MQLHNLQRENKNKTHKRVGRGGKRGTTSGRGTKGQLAHGGTPRPEIRDFIKKFPKKRGYRFNSVAPKHAQVNVSKIEELFEKGTTITPKLLLDAELVRKITGRVPKVKILGNGEITKSFKFEKFTFSASAKEKIEKAGGTIV
ncbi:uL15 family ribosomal protein [Candidatus Wolfebacteria bacterium]|nr:uL15 family ribosomal protein [Candidatus Wolfebacteria bacterium]